MIPCRKIMVMLGRYGDICSLLPLVWHEHRIGNKPIVCVAEEFEELLDGVSYCERLVYPGLYNDPPAALRWLKAARPRDQIVLCQAYRHPFDPNKITGSWQTENWRVAGALDKFGQFPTIFDQRDHQDEGTWLRQAGYLPNDKPMILVAAESVSSPFRLKHDLFQQIEEEFGEAYAVVDLSKIRTPKPYQLAGMFDRAACLVAVDTFPLHLSRASKIPVVAILNDGYFGSIPPPATLRAIRYADCATGLGAVMEAVSEVVENERKHRFVVHACDLHGKTERHQRAQKTWDAAVGDEEMIEHYTVTEGKPKLKDLLRGALGKAVDDRDVVVFSNDDVAFSPGSFREFRLHAGLWGACSIRRTEPGSTGVHIGRETFAFRADWLADHLDDIPDFTLAAPAWDLVLAALIRNERGIVSTLDNLSMDFWPCELSPGLVIHEPHRSSWAGEDEHTRPENLQNLALARQWASANCPTLKL